MIVTVTLNPALQVDYEAGRIAVGKANPVRRVRYRTGGRGLAVAGHCGAGKGTMRRMNASHPRSPRTRRATGARRAWEPTL